MSDDPFAGRRDRYPTGGRHPDGSSWNPNQDRGEGRYSDYSDDDPKFRSDIKHKGDERCASCGKRFKSGDSKYQKVIPDFSVAGRGAICENCYRKDGDPSAPTPHQGDSPPYIPPTFAKKKKKRFLYDPLEDQSIGTYQENRAKVT